MSTTQHDVWASGDAYEPFVGRWSRRAAREFIAWWLDVGCGTGALTQTILTTAAPMRGARRRSFGGIRRLCTRLGGAARSCPLPHLQRPCRSTPARPPVVLKRWPQCYFKSGVPAPIPHGEACCRDRR